MSYEMKIAAGIALSLLGGAGCIDDAMIVESGGYAVEVASPHLVISEINPANDDREFIEIVNPSSETVNLSNYYLSDDEAYATLPARYNHTSADDQYIDPNYDFIAKFPDGAQIGPGEVIVVAFRPARFIARFNSNPDYGLIDPGIPSSIPIMDDLGGLVPSKANLQNDGEAVILFYWDGESDLVQDVDIVIAGHAPASYNTFRNKTLLAVDGPDADTTRSVYALDAATLTDMAGDAGFNPGPPASAYTYKRIRLETGYEVQNGNGNGITGDDETSEDTSMTWSQTFSLATPGQSPLSITP